ncbi:MAG: ABC transporter substrate-binding protein [Bacteroidia bacterium]
MMGRSVEIPKRPFRIISTVPSQTELLFDLGLDEEIVGVTWFCIHPAEKVKNKAKIGGTKNLKLDIIRELKPDLIIANKEENDREQIESLAKEFPVWISDIFTLEDSLDMMIKVGEITGKRVEAEQLVSEIKAGFSTVLKLSEPLKTLYLIWKDPYMSIGKNTFIHHLLTEVCGLQNICAYDLRYPELSVEKIKELNPELVLLSSEPYPFKEKHIRELQEMLPNAKIQLVDGEMFSWYGSRLKLVPEYLGKFLAELEN